MSLRKSLMMAAAAAVAAVLVAARPASAQTETQADSARRLAPVIVTATPATTPDGREITRENRRFARELSAYDRRIGQLENHLERLKTVVSDSLTAEAARLDRAVAETRARRLELEARLRKLETGRGAPDDVKGDDNR